MNDGLIEQLNSSLYRPTAEGLEYAKLNPFVQPEADALKTLSDRNLVIFVWEAGLDQITRLVRNKLRRSGYLSAQHRSIRWTQKAEVIFEEERRKASAEPTRA
jgi:hypothetical protein